MMRKLLFVGAALLAISLTGCDLYYGTDRNSDCAFWECEEEVWQTDPIAPGGACTENIQCAAGCYCAGATENGAGECVETGFCDRSSDCPGDFVCDDRATCIPADDQPGSCREQGCPDGSLCDQATGQCVPSNGCVTEDDCGPGFSCAPDGTCFPLECNSDSDCLEGCFCNDDSVCQETGFCNNDDDCMQECDAAGENCTQMECDTDRNTCVPGTQLPPPPPLSVCNGDITCADGAPNCGADEAAEIDPATGCYTGACVAVAECDGTPLARCEDLGDFESCDARSDCWSQYIGTNCTCDVGGDQGPVACNCANPPPDENGNPSVCVCANWNFSCRSN